ncbi:hypothetical protein RI065_06100 [Mycoplasmatota bacterium zrk1]
MDKELDSIIEKEIINQEFEEWFGEFPCKRTIWSSDEPIENATLIFNYQNGTDELRLYINDSSRPTEILNPGESYKKTKINLYRIEICCGNETPVSNNRCLNMCKRRRINESHCSGTIRICTYHKKPCVKPKCNYALWLIIFILNVIIAHSCSDCC